MATEVMRGCNFWQEQAIVTTTAKTNVLGICKTLLSLTDPFRLICLSARGPSFVFLPLSQYLRKEKAHYSKKQSAREWRLSMVFLFRLQCWSV
mmetsp:Transcript_53106/g.91203  ORF Transcript_53106/g.91203 Transcript_53106/m.91203 type:complete len:93 (+) Transcript_53106:65-343(+)